MTLPYARLTLDAEIAGVERTGVFELPGGPQGASSIGEIYRTGFLVEDTGTGVLALLSRLRDDIDLDDGTVRVSGGGQHAFAIDAEAPTTTTKPNSTEPYQWGSSPDPTVGPNKHTATGAHKEAQQAVLMSYIRNGVAGDSFTPATLELFEHSESGIYEPLTVGLEDPETAIVNDDPTAADVSFTAVSVLDVDQALSQLQRLP
ncbi:hypothetical protein Hbl1158_02875 [Halobaculum sp. CBA1158]|uniref:hypothetical protein n=1 Tax=Halobaculum sp. CBA1158 TaxID=2904243 RepID=UPI001F2ACAD2|nr:hypothetical protein [Halobaculum sp. CBA1158]UIP00330.1 hypothetical protein Hbl1158_02875 [Halobaculum sp. CBA1158]